MIEHTRSGIGKCKVALIVRSNTNGSRNFDSGSWRRLGKTMFDYYVSLRQSADTQEVGARVAGISVPGTGFGIVMLTSQLKEILEAFS